MDFPVEATIHLANFPNKTKVREILRSHGFTLTELSGDRLRVRGSFLKLKAAKASLEPLLDSQTKMDIMPASSGAIPKPYNNSSGVTRSRLGSPNKPPHASPSSPTASSSWASGSSNYHPTSPEYRPSFYQRPEPRCSIRSRRESFVVDADVFRYASRLRKKDIDGILDCHNVKMEECPVGNSFNISIVGQSASIAVGKLQSLLNDLNKSLRTQEVPLKDMDHQGRALLNKIQKNKDIHNSVLICAMTDKLHLIGPSGESYELKQRLLGSPVDQSGRTGRTLDKNSKRRTSSLPPIRPKTTDRDSGAIAYPSPAGAAGYSPSKYQDNKQEVAEPKRGAASHLNIFGSLRRRSRSVSREKTRVERATDDVPTPPKSVKKGIKQLLKFDTKNIGKRFKNMRK